MVRAFDEDDVGKTVVSANGTEIGMVAEVSEGAAQVEPAPGITDRIRSRLGWGDADDGTYPLRADAVATVTDDEVRLSAADTESG